MSSILRNRLVVGSAASVADAWCGAITESEAAASAMQEDRTLLAVPVEPDKLTALPPAFDFEDMNHLQHASIPG